MEPRIVVRFKKPWDKYCAGDVAAFRKSTADQLAAVSPKIVETLGPVGKVKSQAAKG